MITTTKKRRALLSAALVLVSAGVFASQQASATLSGAAFEGNDGNIVPAGTGTDWSNLVAKGGTLAVGTDQQTGQCDNSFTQGSKEDETAVVIGLGSIPNNKADIGKFAVGSQTIATGARAGHVQMDLAWIRNNDGGTTNFDFEINQKAQPDLSIACPGGVDRAVTLVRTGDGAGPLTDDILIGYDLQGGSSSPTLTIRKWGGSAWGNAVTLSATDSEGLINSAAAITAANSGPFNQAIAITRFGEADIDLTAAGIIPNQNDPTAGCVSFGSAYVKSRASSSFSAQMKDYAGPIGIGLNTCATITIDKVTDPAGSAQSFGFTTTGAGTSAFSLTDTATPQVFSGLVPGNYTVAETGVAGWNLTNLVCNDANGSVSIATRTASIHLDAKENVLCTYTNTLQRGSITVVKHTDPAGSTQSFPFTASYNAAGFSLTDGQSNPSGPLLPGTYAVGETLPSGWTQTSATCSDGSPITAIVVSPGENITCTFNNQARGRIIVTKLTDPTQSTQVFGFNPSYGAPFNLTDGQSNDSGAIAPGTYSVVEPFVGGWQNLSATCDDGSTVDSISVSPGETVTCVFTNRQDAHIVVIKHTDPAGDPTKFDFTANYSAPFSLSDGQSYDGGVLAPGTYSVGENTPLGWDLTGTTCSDGSPVSAISLQAGEVVTCDFTNTKRAVIIVTKVVQGPDPDGQSFGFVPSYGDSFSLVNGQSMASGSLVPGTYSVSEDTLANWLLLGATCNDGSPVTGIVLSAGETVECTFTNERQVGALRIVKTAKNAAAAGGVAPVAGVKFDVTDAAGVVDTYTTGADGTVCVNNYGFQTLNVHEQVPAGYAPIADQQVVINAVSYCDPETYGAAPFDAPFVNVPLTNLTITVDSQIDGATNSRIVCKDSNGNILDTQTAGDGSLFIPDLKPTDPLVATMHCDVFIDP